MDIDDADGEGPPRGTAPREAISTLLSDQRRRYFLYCLFFRERRMDLADVAEQVTEWEYGRPGEDVPKARLRVYMSLYHDHVPELAEAGLLRYSQPADVVELTAEADDLAPQLEQWAREELDESERP